MGDDYGRFLTMMRGTLTILSLLSVIFFPWQLSVFLALLAASVEPLVPLAVGIWADTLYFVPSEGGWPIYSFLGVLATAVAFFVRSRLITGIMRR